MLRCALVLTLSAFLVGCGEEPTQKTEINPAATVVPTTPQPNRGIPSSGGATKKKPDPVGAMSPIIPPAGR